MIFYDLFENDEENTVSGVFPESGREGFLQKKRRH